MNHYQKLFPIKIYYSLSRMINPLGEFKGKGFPIDRIMTAFDIDASHDGEHLIGKNGICGLCAEDAFNKKKNMERILNEEGFHGLIFHSGAKGFHLYLTTPDGSFLEDSKEILEKFTVKWKDYVDNFLSKTTKTFDQHRIFKVPETVDASTGVVVSQEFKRLKFKDQLEEHNI